ncbi:hypothetical protein KP509_06G007700 [Ceratopteris richardii]|uniref:C2H2-type domain-containing protein n=1 Tax=Ceratopteris richardii TaxID=49495 RepID=A0A8T2UHW2_CERRI|nr:hypothetical protein KP509_06G007700 [Ceratopteris richardii]
MEERISSIIHRKDSCHRLLGQLRTYENGGQMQIVATSNISLGSGLQCMSPSSQQQIQMPPQNSAVIETRSLPSDPVYYVDSFRPQNGHNSANQYGSRMLLFPSPQSCGGRENGERDPPTSGEASLQALLGIISITQQRLEQMGTILRTMMFGDGEQELASWQQQRLSTSFASVTSSVMALADSLSYDAFPIDVASELSDSSVFGLDGVNGDYLSSCAGERFFGPTSSSSLDAMQASYLMDEDACVAFQAIGTGRVHAPTSSWKGNAVTPIVNASHPISESYREAKGVHNSDEGERLRPGSYDLVELAATEILAEHTHFCEICGKGFKRDANLRMHMRGHGEEYKTVAALAKPDRVPPDASVKPRVYSCPYEGCKRNKNHCKFQPLKTTVCVKNHYRRSHCPKVLVCSRCKSKKFSIVADLKTHEKHCGKEKWHCSCGTTFSRKDKLFGHVSLFEGHSPAAPAAQERAASAGMGDASEPIGICTEVDLSTLPAILATVEAATRAPKYDELDVKQTMHLHDAELPMRALSCIMKNPRSYSEQSLQQKQFFSSK